MSFAQNNISIFLSSTCYDLTDIRSILVNDLQQYGYNVIASDFSKSGFLVIPGLNSIEQCLKNIELCDIFVLILDKRYGPEIPGYRMKSATHLEYEKAIIENKPVLTYVRNEFLSDHLIWQKMIKKKCDPEIISRSLTYVASTPLTSDRYEFEALFAFYDIIRRAKTPKRFNWVDKFEDLNELIQLIHQRIAEVTSEIFNQTLKAKNMVNQTSQETNTNPKRILVLCPLFGASRIWLDL